MEKTNHAMKRTNHHQQPANKPEPKRTRHPDHRLRHNYILKKHHNSSTLEEVTKMIEKPEFNKFISLKKNVHH